MKHYHNFDVALAFNSWFQVPGAYVLTDGQFGSTGKGLLAGAMAECYADRVNMVVTNAGPNSGHTSYFGDEKIVLKQLPTFGVTAMKMHRANNNPPANDMAYNYNGPSVYLSAGAVVDVDLLQREMAEYFSGPSFVHPSAALILPPDKEADQSNVKAMASTGQGVGPALIRKLQRGPTGVISAATPAEYVGFRRRFMEVVPGAVMFFEVSQGYSLGINSGFYPHVTTRECTVSQALSDAGLPPIAFKKSVLSVRTFPIRVGSTENSSGPCYPDQMETDWSKLGVEPELTTVTKRVRRVFTWSDIQFREAVFANDPSVVFCNFIQYVKPEDQEDFVWNRVAKQYLKVKGKLPEAILLGYGPKSSDIKLWRP